MKSQQIGAAQMRHIAEVLKEKLPGLGFTLLVYEFNKPGVSNYISNAKRDDMIKAMVEMVVALTDHKDFNTPEEN